MTQFVSFGDVGCQVGIDTHSVRESRLWSVVSLLSVAEFVISATTVGLDKAFPSNTHLRGRGHGESELVRAFAQVAGISTGPTSSWSPDAP